MVDTLTIENFGPIKKAKIEVKDMMVFIGAQASGKSTLAKLITILNDFNFRKDYRISLKDELAKYNLESFLTSKTKIIFNGPYFAYTYSNEKEYRLDYRAIVEQAGTLPNEEKKLERIKSILKIMVWSFRIDEKEELLHRELLNDNNFGSNQYLFKIFDGVEKYEYADKILDIYSIAKDFEGYKKLSIPVLKAITFVRPLDSLYIPAERAILPLFAPNISGLINNNIKIPRHILQATQELEKALQSIDKISLDIIGDFKLKIDKGISYIYHNKNQRVLLTESASGIQSLVPLILLIEYSLKSKDYFNLNYVVEEPELNLYPEAQYKLIKYLVKNCLETNRNLQNKNLIITTHSPYILTSINNLLFAFNKNKINNKKTNSVINEYCCINPEFFNAYEIKNGTVKRIFNKKSKLIEDNIIDDVSEIILQDFKSLALIND